MIINDFTELSKKIIELQGHNSALISSSMGKDSLAMFLRMYETGLFDKYYFLFLYYFRFDWMEEYIEYFEQKYKCVEVVKIPQPALFRQICCFVYQTPDRIEAIKKIQQSDDYMPRYSFNDCSKLIFFYKNLSENTFTSLGTTIFDSPNRYTVLNKLGAISYNTRRWFPIVDWKLSDIKAIIKKHNEKLPDDYVLFG